VAHEQANEYARDTDDCVGEAEEPGRNFVYTSRCGDPDAKYNGRNNDPPLTRKKSNDEAASEHSNKDH
jgi:hypothetical protein